MDPASAIGLAFGVIGFVDVLTKVVRSVAHKTSNSEHERLLQISDDITDICKDIKIRLEIVTIHATLERDEQRLYALAKSCQKVAEDL